MRWIWDTLQTQLNNSKPQFLWPFVVHSIIWWCCWWHQRMSKVDVYTYCVNKNMDGTYRYTYSYILHYIYIIIYNYIYYVCMWIDQRWLVVSTAPSDIRIFWSSPLHLHCHGWVTLLGRMSLATTRDLTSKHGDWTCKYMDFTLQN